MLITPSTFDGNDINDGTNYRAWFPANTIHAPQMAPVWIDRGNVPAAFAQNDRNVTEIEIRIAMLGTIADQINELNGWFDYAANTARVLVVEDESANEWYCYAVPVTPGVVEGQLYRARLQIADWVFYSNTQDTSTLNVTASGDTIVVAVGGNQIADPIIEITPTSSKGAGQSYMRFSRVYNQTARNFIKYPVEITGGGLDTATLIAGGKMQADGDDLRVYVNGAQVNRWLNGIDTATTKVWIVLDLPRKRETTLETAIAGAGAITTIDIRQSEANTQALQGLPAVGILNIGNELFSYTGIKINEYGISQFTGVTRSIRGSSAAAHSTGATVRWLPYDVVMVYGDSTLGAPNTDDTEKPIIDLTSTNTSWIYTDFTTASGNRAASWQPVVYGQVGPNSRIYSATQNALSTTASVMGVAARSYQNSNTYLSGGIGATWTVYVPSGATTIASSSGSSYRTQAGWFGTAQIQVATDPEVYTAAYSVASPGSATTWTAWSSGSVALGATYQYIRFGAQGSAPGGADNLLAVEMTAITLTLDSGATPSVTLSSEFSAYELNCVITNTTSTDALYIVYAMELNQTLQIDTATKEVTYLKTNQSAVNALRLSKGNVRDRWLGLSPGNSTIRYDETGAAGVTVAIKRRDRSTV